MPGITTQVPRLTGDAARDVKILSNTVMSLIDELAFVLNNLGPDNVIEASKVKAENIDTNNAKIGNAQISSLKADKITSGTIDTNNVKIANKDGENICIDGKELVFKDINGKKRCLIGTDKTGKYSFQLNDPNETATVYIKDNGAALFKGEIEASTICSSTIYADNTSDSPYMVLGNVSGKPFLANFELYNGLYNGETKHPNFAIRSSATSGSTVDGLCFYAGTFDFPPLKFLQVDSISQEVDTNPAEFTWYFAPNSLMIGDYSISTYIDNKINSYLNSNIDDYLDGYATRSYVQNNFTTPSDVYDILDSYFSE